MTTTTKNSNRPVFDAAFADAAASGAALNTRLVTFAAFDAAGVTPASLSGKGKHMGEVKEAILEAWQGEEFAALFNSVKTGTTVLAGRKTDRFGGVEPIEKKRAIWAGELSKKVADLRTAYTAWIQAGSDADKVVESAGPSAPAAAKAKADAAKVGAGKVTKRELSVRIEAEIKKLLLAVVADQATLLDKPAVLDALRSVLAAIK